MAYEIEITASSSEEELQDLVGKTVTEVLLETNGHYFHFITSGRKIVGAKSEDLFVRAVLFDNDDGIAFEQARFMVVKNG